MEITEIKNQNQWWRWPLIPIVSITGALITSYLIKIIGIFIFNFLGFGSNSWMQRYFLAALVAGYFGSLLVKISYFTAPNRKLKVARIFAWLFFVFNIANIAFAFLFHIEGKSVIIYGSLFATLGAMSALIGKRNLEFYLILMRNRGR